MKEVSEYAKVIITEDTPECHDGCYDCDSNTIFIRTKLNPKRKLYTLAHEIGHAYYKHSSVDLYEALEEEQQAINYSMLLAKRFGFYSKQFEKEIKRQYKFIASKKCRDWFKKLGFREGDNYAQ